MKTKPILLVAGEPNSIFLEILFKILKNQTLKNPLILIASYKLLKLQMNKLRFKRSVKILDIDKILKDNSKVAQTIFVKVPILIIRNHTKNQKPQQESKVDIAEINLEQNLNH